MEWDRRKRSGANKLREAGLIMLAVGVLVLAAGIVLTFTLGTLLAPTLIGSSILINTVAVICLREGRRRREGDGE